METYGLTESEKNLHLYKYNHALFQNMKGFMDACWEINLINSTVIMLHEKYHPELLGKQFDFAMLIRELIDKKVYYQEQKRAAEWFSMENLKTLKEERTADIHLLGEAGIPEMNRFILTPVIEASGVINCLYMSIKNVEADERRLKRMEMEKAAVFAAMSTTYPCVIYANLTRNVCDTYANAGMGDKLPMQGGYDEIYEAVQEDILPEYREGFLEKFGYEALVRHFENGHEFVEMELQQEYADGLHWILMKAARVDTEGDPDLVVVILTALIDSRKENERLEKLALEMSNRDLRRTLSMEEQYRQAVISGAILVYNINLSKNLIEDEIFEVVEGKRIPILPLVGMKAPCPFDEFAKMWCDLKVAKEDKEQFLKIYNHKYMLDCYARGEAEIVQEFRTKAGRDILIVLRQTILITRSEDTGDILALCNAKDVTAQKEEEFQTRIILQEAYEAANRASQAKSDFLSCMSHDMRTPMNAVIGMAAVALGHIDDKEKVADCLNKIFTSGRYLLGIINEVLDMSKIESGRIELSEEPFDLCDMLNGMIEICREGIDKKGHELKVNIDTQHRHVIGDALRIRQVCMNFMSNAIKYTPKGGKIAVSLREKPSEISQNGCYEFVFEDNGIGMPKDYIEHIFEPFSRAEDTRTNKIQGTGLGMTIAKNIVSMMDGDIRVESEQEKGSRFTMTLYLKLQERERGPADKEGGDTNDILERVRKADYSGRRVLIAEDNEINAEIAMEILKMCGIEAETARDGQEAVERFLEKERGYYDLIFMDIQMPRMNGYEAVRAIRALPRDDAGQIPIIAITANAFTDDIQTSAAAGMNGHIAKPLDITKLTEVLERWLK